MIGDTQSRFSGWAIVEMFGHQQIAGFVTTEYYGQSCMFRVDVPDAPERENAERFGQILAGDGKVIYADRRVAKSKHPAEPAYTRLIGPGAIYAINPCTEETAREFVDRNRRLPVIPLDIPAHRNGSRLIEGAYTDTYEREPMDDEI